MTRAILRLARSSKQKLWQAIDLLCAAAQSGSKNSEEAFYDMLSSFAFEYGVTFGIALKRPSSEKSLLTQADILHRLEKDYGIVLERKAVGCNISILREAGIDIAEIP